MKTISLTEH